MRTSRIAHAIHGEAVSRPMYPANVYLPVQAQYVTGGPLHPCYDDFITWAKCIKERSDCQESFERLKACIKNNGVW